MAASIACFVYCITFNDKKYIRPLLSYGHRELTCSFHDSSDPSSPLAPDSDTTSHFKNDQDSQHKSPCFKSKIQVSFIIVVLNHLSSSIISGHLSYRGGLHHTPYLSIKPRNLCVHVCMCVCVCVCVCVFLKYLCRSGSD